MRKIAVVLLVPLVVLAALTGCGPGDGSAEGARMADALRALPAVTRVETGTRRTDVFAASSSSTTVTATIGDDATLTDLVVVQEVLVERDHEALVTELLYRDFVVHGVVEPDQLATLLPRPRGSSTTR